MEENLPMISSIPEERNEMNSLRMEQGWHLSSEPSIEPLSNNNDVNPMVFDGVVFYDPNTGEPYGFELDEKFSVLSEEEKQIIREIQFGAPLALPKPTSNWDDAERQAKELVAQVGKILDKIL